MGGGIGAGSTFGAVSLLCDFLSLISGEIATIVGCIVIVITGILFAAGEAKGMFGWALRVLMGLGIAMGIANFGPDIGLNFSQYCGNAVTTLGTPS